MIFQVRNVASIGGSILWNHPASDIIPLLLASGAMLSVVNTDGQETKVSLSQMVLEGLARGHLLLQVNVPLSKTKEVRYFKHAQRSTADLAIANMAVGYQVSGNKVTNIET